MKEYTAEQQRQIAIELRKASKMMQELIIDYDVQRQKIRACLNMQRRVS